ncbi:NACHT domain-containing protein [Rhizohabitans arisaemae]|uniref:NACHT domain-containing protein n=1 Tax=Rhizohabitans arisaemae TaxID=2720610 RepID=UPI0024B24629|nr:NACHT domain-containing protein [Rhizohabitans arisaemae]
MAVEAAVLGLGKAVGEQALRTWLTSRSSAENRNRDLVDLMRSRFPDQLVRRKAQRQIEDIADAVTARVLKVCAHEFPGLGDNDRQAVVAEVTETLQQADLSDHALLAADADHVRLAQAVRESLPIPKDLGEAASRLYEVVLDECCDCLVRIVRQLPEFQPRAAAEMLARLSGVGEQIAAVLERLPVRTLDAPDGTDHDAEFRRRYLEHVSQTLDTLELLGIRVERFLPRTSLSVAYISLTVSAMRSRVNPGSWHEAANEPATMRVESALGQGRRMLLRGEAGGGKSTLLRWLSITAARGGFAGELAEWNGCVPYLIKLRSYADRELPRPEQFLDLTAGALAGLMPAGWTHRQLASGRALLLIDGVDELTGNQRKAIRPWLHGLLTQFPGIRVVITSRPSAAASAWLDEEGFSPAFMERMTPSDTRALIEHWHEAIRTRSDLPCSAEQLPVVQARLLSHLDNAPHLRALGATPLLASMLCALNLDRSSQLPPDRMSLYAAALEMLLERRDAERTIPSYGDVHLDRAQKIQVLQELAWQLSVTNRVELAKSAALARVEKVVAAMPRVQATGAQVLDYLIDRSGVIREPVDGRIDFVHRTVQEYLTARAAAEDGDIEPLVLYANRDQWREVVVMAAGHANGPIREALLSGLLSRIANEPRQARRLKVLVCACLETLPSVPDRLRGRVDECLQALIPPRDTASARSLALAGQVVLDRLPRDLSRLSSASARASVRTAWLINGPHALDLLARYASDGRPEVEDELITGWRYFDPELYAKRVLSSIKAQSNSLPIHTTRQLEALPYIAPQNAISIYLPHTEDLTPLLSHQESLKVLFILPASKEALQIVRHLSNLTSISTGGMDEIGFLSKLDQLMNVHLYQAHKLTDLTPLNSLENLKHLTIVNAGLLTDWEMLPALNRLVSFSLSRVPLAIDSLHELTQRIPLLKALHLRHYEHLSNLAVLSKLNLLQLDLWGTKSLHDISPISGCTTLTSLDLGGTRVGNLSPLTALKKLRAVGLSNCREIRDLSPLADLSNLRQLWINNSTPNLDLAPLAKNENLRVYIKSGQEVRNSHLLNKRPKKLIH